MPHTLNVGAPSRFVNLVAWAAIVMAALVAVIAGLQYAQVASMLPQGQQRPLPLLSAWLLRDLPWVLGAAAMLSLLLMAAAIGLLLRLDWARRTFIALVMAAIAVHLGGLWLQHELVQVLVLDSLPAGSVPAAVVGLFGGLATAAQVLAMVVTLAACMLLAWVIARLRSEPVLQEFA